MESQKNTPSTGTPQSDSNSGPDRSRFLTTLGFDRLQLQAEQDSGDRSRGNLDPAGSSSEEELSEPVREVTTLSSAFDNTSSQPAERSQRGGVTREEPLLSGPRLETSDQNGLVLKADHSLEDSVPPVEDEQLLPKQAPTQPQDGPAIETVFEEERNFDVHELDEEIWQAIDQELRPDWPGLDVAEAELNLAPLKKVKKKSPEPTGPGLMAATSEIDVPVSDKPPANESGPEPEQPAVPENVSTAITVSCPSCNKGLTLQPQHLGIAGQCVWCDLPIIAAVSGVDQKVNVFPLATLPAEPSAPEETEVSNLEPPSLPDPSDRVVDQEEVPSSANEPAKVEEDSDPEENGADESEDWTNPVDGFAPLDSLAPMESNELQEEQPIGPQVSNVVISPFEEAIPQEDQGPGTADEPEKPGIESNPPAETSANLDSPWKAPVGPAEPFASISELDQTTEPELEPEGSVDTEPEPGVALPTEMPVLKTPASPNAVPLSQMDESGPTESANPMSISDQQPAMKSAFGSPAPNPEESPEPSFLPPVNNLPLPQETSTSPVSLPTENSLASTSTDTPSFSTQMPWETPSDADRVGNLASSSPDTTLGTVDEPSTETPTEPVSAPASIPPDTAAVPEVSLPGTDAPLPAPNPIAPGISVSPSQEKIRKPKGKSSKAAIFVALFGLISGIGLASFFLPMEGYFKDIKESVQSWIESSMGVDNEWVQPEPMPRQSSYEDEPDPFLTTTPPGSDTINY
ncbi:MAG: hypothetical protein HKN23_20870 [Verrucomicrobiales bacterium]|nr:hypothetical protein [Verrucomicrobiales bacterium]